MNDTEERILRAALKLFAKDGYEAASVSAIAKIVGVTKGALYRHYRSKREIFDHIVERMVQADVARARKHEVPEETFDRSPEAYRNATTDKLQRFLISQFRFWTEDEFGCDFRKMVTLEQYRNPEIAALYQTIFADGPLRYLEDLFREMMAQNIFKESNPRLLALGFYAPFHLLMSVADAAPAGPPPIDLLTAYIENFIRENSAERSLQRADNKEL